MPKPFKQRFEENFSLGVLGVLFIGFVAGFGTYEAILRIAALKVVRAELAVSPPTGTAQPKLPEGFDPTVYIDRLTQDHIARIAKLHAAFEKQEEQATHGGNIEHYKKENVASAERIRKAIEAEHASYKASVEALRALDRR